MSNQPPPPPPDGNQPPGGYPQQGGQYPPQGGQYPPQGGQYPPQGGQYPPQGGGYQGGYQEQPKGGSGLAITSLILGILAFFGSFIVIGGLLALVGLVLGFIAASRARKGRATGRGIAIAGIVVNLIAIVISVLIGVFIGSFFDEAQNLTDCLSQAGDDQAAIEQCEQDFEDEVVN